MSSQILTLEEIKNRAPAVFEAEPASTVNKNKYRLINTGDLLEPLADQGWNVVAADQRRTQKDEWINKSYHVVRLRSNLYVGDDHLELVISNSHNASSSFKIQLGIYRLVCSNGLTVGTDLVSPLMLQHKGLSSRLITEIATMYASNMANYVIDATYAMKRTHISLEQKKEMAEFVRKLKHRKGVVDGVPEYYEANLNEMILPKRYEDYGDDLWTTYNVIQENMMRGGYSIKGDNDKWRRARAINSPSSAVELNAKLFDKALEYAA